MYVTEFEYRNSANFEVFFVKKEKTPFFCKEIQWGRISLLVNPYFFAKEGVDPLALDALIRNSLLQNGLQNKLHGH